MNTKNFNLLEQLAWRTTPGILGKHPSSVQSVHALLGYYLKDRTSPTPFPGRDELVHSASFELGAVPPLEKVIQGPRELELLLGLPELYRQSVSVIEPWPNVGINRQGETVRASKNIAYLLQQIADADTILYPIWQSGVAHPQRLANVPSGGIATVLEGGDPSAYDAAGFDGSSASLNDILNLVDQLLLRRSAGTAPTIFICLGHQLAMASHVRLIHRVVREVMSLDHLRLDSRGKALASLKRVCTKISDVGESSTVVKRGKTITSGWLDPSFAVARNESFEVGTRRLMPSTGSPHADHVPLELHDTHALIADELEGVIDTMISLDANSTSKCSMVTKSTRKQRCLPIGHTRIFTIRPFRFATNWRSVRCPGC